MNWIGRRSRPNGKNKPFSHSLRAEPLTSTDTKLPLQLCTLCETLSIEYKPGYTGWFSAVKHYSTFSALLASAQGGCGLCDLFLNEILSKSAQERDLSIDAARSFHLKLDQEPNVHAFSFSGVPDAYTKDEQSRQLFSYATYSRSTDENCDWAKFALTAPWDSKAVQRDAVNGREMTALADFSLAKDWIVECQHSHPKCSSVNDHVALPTTVIDLRPFSRGGSPRLLCSYQEEGQYVALSHVWGHQKPLLTTSQNLKAHMHEIPIDSMPLTFRDADSSEDWQQECANMGSVYQNAAVTIAGAAAAGPCDGFLKSRPIPQHSVWEYKKGSDTSIRRVNIRPHDLYDTRPEKGSTLVKRAWILQERLLSPRVLYFGSQQMYWECKTHSRFERQYYPSTYGLSLEAINKTTLQDTTGMSTNSKLVCWYNVVTAFTARQLTYASDRLPALSGVATYLWDAQHTYLAGLLRHDIHRGLLWFVGRKRKRPDGVKEEYIAPSWSWAALDAQISFYPALPSVEYEFNSTITPKPIYDGDLELLEAATCLASPSRFGQVTSGYLKLRGKLKEGTMQAGTLKDYGKTITTLFLCSKGSSEAVARFYPDDLSSWLPESCMRSEEADEAAQAARLKRIVARLRADIPDEPEREDNENKMPFIKLELREVLALLVIRHRGWCGLAVEKLPGTTNTYRRIGLFGNVRGPMSYNGLLPRDTWFDGVAAQTLVLT